MSDCASAGTSLAVGKQHLIQPSEGMRAVTDLSLLDDAGTAHHRQASSGPLLPPFSRSQTEAGATDRLAGWQSCQGSLRFDAGAGSLVGPQRCSLVLLEMRSF